MAFTVWGDHERQEQVFERLKASYASYETIDPGNLLHCALELSIDTAGSGAAGPADLDWRLRIQLPVEISCLWMDRDQGPQWARS
ncbi:hypothetical protein [Beijerinckia sp. L45]|uniref:hypothetical protein n=1 Tax=Beijerinckia sp. L45 TaxID=1641855 RepID=UPI00131ECE14|nr:hypothetical protein [Beijerinckia sp. L45]